MFGIIVLLLIIITDKHFFFTENRISLRAVRVMVSKLYGHNEEVRWHIDMLNLIDVTSRQSINASLAVVCQSGLEPL